MLPNHTKGTVGHSTVNPKIMVNTSFVQSHKANQGDVNVSNVVNRSTTKEDKSATAKKEDITLMQQEPSKGIAGQMNTWLSTQITLIVVSLGIFCSLSLVH